MSRWKNPSPFAAGSAKQILQKYYNPIAPGFGAIFNRMLSFFYRNNNISGRNGGGDEALAVRRVVFLQGPAGRTFEKIGRELTRRGHHVRRVNFNFGDQIFWRFGGAVAFRSRLRAWPGFFENLLLRFHATDIILFGDCRPLHRLAIEVAKRNGVAVHVMEEGYIRPNWVTLEQDGVNGHSQLPRDPEWYLAEAVPDPHGAIVEQPYSFTRRAVEDVVYNLGRLAGHFAYPFYRTHRPWHPLWEYAGWIKRLAGQKAEQRRAGQMIAALKAGGQPYFLFPLQLDCDFQVRVHSPFGALRPALEQVIASFARYAPPDTLLAVKQHPLENGLRDWRKMIDTIASKAGVQERIVFLEAGDLCALLRDAKGMVTINSTSGMDALAAQVPLIVLGQAVYDMPGLTNGADLDRFWQHGQKPRPELLQAFRSVLMQHCLIPGGFYSAEGIRAIVAGAVRRLEIYGQPAMAPAGSIRAEHAVKAPACT